MPFFPSQFICWATQAIWLVVFTQSAFYWLHTNVLFSSCSFEFPENWQPDLDSGLILWQYKRWYIVWLPEAQNVSFLFFFFFFNPDTNWCLMPIFIPGGCQLWYSGFIISFVFCLINEDMLLIIYYLTTQWHSSFKERDGSFSTLSLIIGFQYNWLVPIIIKDDRFFFFLFIIMNSWIYTYLMDFNVLQLLLFF